jgi:uncharacterized protein (DUF58 family)
VITARYHAGDDFRYIDWNVYSRLRSPVFSSSLLPKKISPFISLLIPANRCRWGPPPKLDYARRVAAALGYIGLNGLDRVGAVSFADELGRPMPPQRGRQQIFALFRYFEALQGQGGTHLNRVLSNYARQSSKGGLAIVLSDLLDANGYARGLDALAYGRFDVLVIQARG